MHFLVNVSPPKPLDIAISNFAYVKVTWRTGYRATSFMTRSLGQGQRLYFHVNASPKPLDLATSNFADA